MKLKLHYLLLLLLILNMPIVIKAQDLTTTTISGSISWEDDNNSLAKRPDKITVNLYADGEKVDSKIVMKPQATNNFTRYFDNRYTIKKMDSVLDNTYNYTYVAFSGGIKFNNKELYAARASYNHFTSTDPERWGKIVFFERKKDGVDIIYPNIDYKYNGELRDPNLSNTNYDDKFFLSSFTTDENNNHKSVLMILDKNYNVISDTVLDEKIFWGNTLITPNKHILKPYYYDNKIYLLISNEQFKGSLDNITFDTIQIQTNSSSAEPTIGYYNDMLVLISRVHNENSEIFYTKDLEGKTGWSEPKKLNYQIHSPVLLANYKGNKLLFAGSMIKDTGYRVPVIGYVDVLNGKITKILEVDNDIDEFSGYPALVEHDSGYGMIYYQNQVGNVNTGLYLKDIPRSFDTENLYSYDWKWTFADKPLTNENGEKIKYTIGCEKIDNYEINTEGYNLMANIIKSSNDNINIITKDTTKETNSNDNNNFINNIRENPHTGDLIYIVFIIGFLSIITIIYFIRKNNKVESQ